MEDTRTSILQMARGAIMERIDYEMTKVVDNILDPNTEATAKRKVQLTIEFRPDSNRQTVSVACGVKSALCPTNPVATSLYITGNEFGDHGGGNGTERARPAGYDGRRTGSSTRLEFG